MSLAYHSSCPRQICSTVLHNSTRLHGRRIVNATKWKGCWKNNVLRWLLRVLVARGQRRPAEQPFSRIHVYPCMVCRTYLHDTCLFFFVVNVEVQNSHTIHSLEDLLDKHQQSCSLNQNVPVDPTELRDYKLWRTRWKKWIFLEGGILNLGFVQSVFFTLTKFGKSPKIPPS